MISMQGKEADVSVAEALKVGYRHIDCALVSPCSCMMMVVVTNP
jgi:hypothetical protein